MAWLLHQSSGKRLPLRWNVFLDNEMGIRPASTEGGDARDSWILPDVAINLDTRPLPCRQLSLDHEGRSLEIDVGVQGLGVERGRQLAMLELQQNLGDACDARRTLAMPDIGFDRANGAEVPVPGVGRRWLLVKAVISMGSPRDVPVPWASR